MAIINIIDKQEGNKAYAAHANFSNDAGYLKAGDSIDVQAEFFNQIGNSLGVQGLLHVVADTLPGWEPDALNGVGGITIYNYMKSFCKAIQQGWDPTVSCWASEVSRTMTRFNIMPKGSDGNVFPIATRYELLRIQQWLIVEV